MPPNPISASQLCKETAISDVTLYRWRKDYKNRGIAVPGDQSKPENWAAEDKLTVIIETAGLIDPQYYEFVSIYEILISKRQQTLARFSSLLKKHY